VQCLSSRIDPDGEDCRCEFPVTGVASDDCGWTPLRVKVRVTLIRVIEVRDEGSTNVTSVGFVG
jgi:hypothetical protein